jgi:hypothetical protein
MAQSSNPLDKLNNTSANKNSGTYMEEGNFSRVQFRCVFGQKGHKLITRFFSPEDALPD